MISTVQIQKSLPDQYYHNLIKSGDSTFSDWGPMTLRLTAKSTRMLQVNLFRLFDIPANVSFAKYKSDFYFLTQVRKAVIGKI